MGWRIEQQADGTWAVIRPDGGIVVTAAGVRNTTGPDAAAAWPDRAHAMAAMLVAIEADHDPDLRGGGLAALFAAPTPEPAADGADAGDGEPAAPLGQRWLSDAAFEGVVTNDGRALAVGTTTFRAPPLPLMLQTVTAYGHDGAELVGFADTTGRDGEGEGATLTMGGVLESGEAGTRATELLQEHGTFGVSIDPGYPEDVISECVRLDDAGFCSMWRDTYVGVPIMGLTMTPFPAFASARIWLEGTTPPALAQQDTLLSQAPEAVDPEADLLDLLLASAVPTVPPAAWFDDPMFTADHPDMEFGAEGCPLGVPLTVTDDGHVYGHVATWAQCHTGYSDRCVLAPHSAADYAYFRTGTVMALDADGQSVQVRTGPLTMGLGHADLHMGHREAAAHYDDARTGIADVAVGEDEFGIWFAGAIRPGVTDEQLRVFRACSLSGDWRPIAGNLELVAALAVNVPGFPIPRGGRTALAASAAPAMREQAGQVVALVAAGMVVNNPRRLQPQHSPWGQRMEKRIAQLERLVELAGLRGLAAAALRDRVERLG